MSEGKSGDAPNTGRRLRIVHINDTHHFHLGSQPTRTTEVVDRGGSSDDGIGGTVSTPIYNVAEYLGTARREAEENEVDLLYLSAGDEHTGTSLDELLGYAPETYRRSTAYALQSILGLDTATIGNHDLDRGPRILQEAITKSADFPVLSANIRDSLHLIDYYATLIGETVHGVSVGIIGVTTNEQIDVRSTLDPQFVFEDPIGATLRWYRRIAPIVDVVIILSHLGLNVPGSRHRSKQDDRVLAQALAGYRVSDAGGPITLIIGGHTHTVIDPTTGPVVIEGIQIFQAGCNMEYLGDIQVDLAERSVQGRLVALDDRHGKEARGNVPLGTTISHTLTQLRKTVLTPVATLSRSEGADVFTTLADRLSGECALANAITDAVRNHFTMASGGSVVVACDASGIQSGLTEENTAEGIIRIDDLYRILPYADSIYRAILFPKQLVAILESNALRRIPANRLVSAGGEIGLMDWSKIARGYLHFSGNLRYRITGTNGGESHAAGSQSPQPPHLTEILLDGKPIESYPDDYEIVMYCNSFSALGNQGWSEKDESNFQEFGFVSLPALGFNDTGEPFRSVLIESLMQLGVVSIVRDGRVKVLYTDDRDVHI